MTEMTPEQVFNAFKSSEMDKETAKNYLLSFIDNSKDWSLRVLSFNFICNLDLNKDDFFKILENALVSDKDGRIRIIAARYIVKKFLDKGEEALKSVIKRGGSEDLLFKIYSSLESSSSKKALSLVRYMEETVGKRFIEKYGSEISLDECFFLGMMDQDGLVSGPKDGCDGHIWLSFHHADGHIHKIYSNGCAPGFKFLKRLPHLKVLENAYGELENLNGIQDLIGLEKFVLKGMDIEDFSQIEGIFSLINLKELHCYDINGINELGPFNKLINLRKLSITGDLDCDRMNPLQEIKDINSLTKLEHLDLRSNNITEIEGVENLTSLRSLNLSGNRINEIESLDNLVNLKSLFINGGQGWAAEEEGREDKGDITEIKGVENLASLEVLILTNNKITEIKGLDNLRNLKELHIDQNFIKEINGLDNLKNLEVLNLRGNDNINLKGVENLESLKTLLISEDQVPDIDAKLFKSLNFTYWEGIRGERLQKLLDHYRSL